jgi:predicted DNA-binding ribbon-helix-helix protein
VIRKLRFGESIKPRTARLGDLKTSFRLEAEFWTAVEEIAVTRGISISKLVANIDKRRRHANLSSVIRLYVLDYYRRLAGQRVGRRRTRSEHR